MKATAKKLGPTVAAQDVGTVVAAGDALEIASADGTYAAKRAASCLLAPEVGDQVLVAFIPGRPCYVLAVLERDPGAPARLNVDGDLAIQAAGGRVSIASAEGLDLVTEGDATVVAGGFNVRAARGNVVLDQLALLGSAVVAELGKAKLVTSTLETIADRVVQRAKRAYRFVEELDHMRAERLDVVANGTLSLRGENTVITAEELVKLDGEQIHVG